MKHAYIFLLDVTRSHDLDDHREHEGERRHTVQNRPGMPRNQQCKTRVVKTAAEIIGERSSNEAKTQAQETLWRRGNQSKHAYILF